MKRNPNMSKLKAGYLFPEIGRRKKEFLAKHPDAKLISLGIGNTTEPLTPTVVEGLKDYVQGLGTRMGYTGYDDDSKAQEFLLELKKRISDHFYKGSIDPSEIFVSDGAKPDCGRLQFLFGSNVSIAVQDPVYPVYVDSSVMMGSTGLFDDSLGRFTGIEYMECVAENDFFPKFKNRTDLIYFCSPNNPTGAVATHAQLKELVDFAKRNKSIIVFDAAYSEFIQDDSLPRSIFEIDGAREVAIEVNSFSKPAGFTGVRLGWTVVPSELQFDDGSLVIDDWKRIMGTLFNGSSNIAQQGGIAVLSKEGLEEMKETVNYYMENAKIIKTGLQEIKIKTYGGDNAPYIWAYFGGDSWEAFSWILEKCRVVTTPGVGFGSAGEGYVRFSAFGHREDIVEAVKRLKNIKDE